MQYPTTDELLENHEKPQDEESTITLTNIITQKYDNKGQPTAIMTSSIASILDDSTPSDSGVQLLDSISSGMNESFMSNSGFDYDSNTNNATPAVIECISSNVTLIKQPQCYIDEIKETSVSILPDLTMDTPNELTANNRYLDFDEIAMTKSDIDNSNIDPDFLLADINTDISDEMKTSTCSTFDTDAIVYRRKVKKTRNDSTGSTAGSVKKRVSFHEDILKNTKTDNIHIEHGFITYKGYSKKTPHRFLRNSWCSQGNCDDNEDESSATCYRNACSDVLDYGKNDLYEHGGGDVIKYDNSGVFEYVPQTTPIKSNQTHKSNIERSESNDERKLYNCKCSSSNSSLESDDSANGNENQNKRNDYGRTKSNSCDCIGLANHLNNNSASGERSPNITDNCYFSEPCIETMDESFETISPKSVWRKEMKPKNSCLKKNRRVIQDHDLNTKVKTFNVHQLSDMNNLFGSLKNIFSMPLPERGVPEGCEDLQTVYECVPEIDSYSPKKVPQLLSAQITNPLTIDSVIQTAAEKQVKRKTELSLFPIPPENEMVHMAIDESSFVPKGTTTTTAHARPNTFRNKFIVNCESTVFEHTGVFCENNKDGEDIPDIPSSSSVCITPQKPTKSILSFSTAPFRQKLSNIFQSFRDTSSSSTAARSEVAHALNVQQQQQKIVERQQQEQLQAQLKKLQDEQLIKSWHGGEYKSNSLTTKFPNENESMGTLSMTSSMISNSSDKNSIFSSSTMTATSSTNTKSGLDQNEKYNLQLPTTKPVESNSNSPNKKTRHLASPLRRKSTGSKFDRTKLSPDLFCMQKTPPNSMVLLSEEFDDLLTITTTETELNGNEIEVNYVAENEITLTPQLDTANNQFLRPPSSKSSLINRFLRNVTQKKINDVTVKKNNILSAKYREPPKLFNNLYVKPAKPINFDFVSDLNAEIALEIEMNGNNGKEAGAKVTPPCLTVRHKEEFGIGVGEVCTDIFDVNNLHILRDDREILMKVSATAFQRSSVFRK